MIFLPLIIVAALIVLSELNIFISKNKLIKIEEIENKRSNEEYHLKIAKLKGFSTVAEWEQSFKN